MGVSDPSAEHGGCMQTGIFDFGSGHEFRQSEGKPSGGWDRGCWEGRRKEGGQLVRKGGFEPPRLSAPPPQDGVSASSTTSAL